MSLSSMPNANVLGVATVDKFNTAEYRKQMIRKIIRVPKMNSKVYKVLGRTWWKEMSFSEMESNQTSLMPSKPELATEEDFQQFMTKEQ